ncbi:hypothetical protein [Kaistella sp.]|uniref:hypothetical protein n=1 Tax=Kaistella sp. TaxID=2782235 RepID=UPI0035A0C9C6
MNDILNENFVRKYSELEFDKNRYYWLHGIDWKLSKKEIIKQLNENLADITDFIWHSLTLSLVNKMIYNYAPQDHLYISNYFRWKTGSSEIFAKFYPHAFCRMTDIVLGNLPGNLRLEVNKISKTNMDLYTDFFISIFNHFDLDLVGIETDAILTRAVDDEYFIKEFSDETGCLSKIYLSSLIHKISKHNQ